MNEQRTGLYVKCAECAHEVTDPGKLGCACRCHDIANKMMAACGRITIDEAAAPRAEGPPPRHAAMLQRLRMIIDDDVSSCTQRAHELTCIERRSEDPCGECELWDCASALLNDLTQATESSPAARGTQALGERERAIVECVQRCEEIAFNMRALATTSDEGSASRDVFEAVARGASNCAAMLGVKLGRPPARVRICDECGDLSCGRPGDNCLRAYFDQQGPGVCHGVLRAAPPPAAARPEEVECDLCLFGAPVGQIGRNCGLPKTVAGRTISCPGTLRAKAATPLAEVYARPECIFSYCPHPDTCKADNRCRSPHKGNE